MKNIIKFAGITYGPLLGLFSFGILTSRIISNSWVWPVCVGGPLVTVILDLLCNPSYYEKLLHMNLGLANLSTSLFDGYKIGPELILINGFFTFVGLFLISKPAIKKG